MSAVRLNPAVFGEAVSKLGFDDAGGCSVTAVFANGARVRGRLVGDGFEFWTFSPLPAAEIVALDGFVGGDK